MGKTGWIFLMFLIWSYSVWGAKYKFVVLETNLGTLKLKVYEDTPRHSENFLKLVKEKHYDGLLFHRVIEGFMIQGGSSDSRHAEKGTMLGIGDPGYVVEAEIRPEHFHQKGALCAARQGDEVNPGKNSSGEQFYIVQGKIYTDQELDRLEAGKLMDAKNKLGAQLFKPRQEEFRTYMQSGRRAQADSLIQAIQQEIDKQFKDYTAHLIPADRREIYKTLGGTPFLDGEYTVFGELVEGYDVLDKIAAQETDKTDRPLEDIVIIKAKLSRK